MKPQAVNTRATKHATEREALRCYTASRDWRRQISESGITSPTAIFDLGFVHKLDQHVGAFCRFSVAFFTLYIICKITSRAPRSAVMVTLVILFQACHMTRDTARLPGRYRSGLSRDDSALAMLSDCRSGRVSRRVTLVSRMGYASHIRPRVWSPWLLKWGLV